jgi:hypothetical protein
VWKFRQRVLTAMKGKLNIWFPLLKRACTMESILLSLAFLIFTIFTVLGLKNAINLEK